MNANNFVKIVRCVQVETNTQKKQPNVQRSVCTFHHFPPDPPAGDCVQIHTPLGGPFGLPQIAVLSLVRRGRYGCAVVATGSARRIR